MGVEINITDNSAEVLKELAAAAEKALEMCGQLGETHAKENITAAGRVDTGAMRNSIAHAVQGDTAYIGTNNEYAPFHEMGTGIYVEDGSGRQSPWAYTDRNGETHWTRGVKPVHFLKNAGADHVDEYEKVIEDTLKGE